MLNALRQRTGSIAVKILLLLLILSFGLWGVNDVFFQQPQQATVAAIGDTEIIGADLELAVSRETARLQQIMGPIDPQRAEELGVVDTTLQRMITGSLIGESARDLGLTASDTVVRDNISQNPAFFGGLGEFENFRFQQALQASGLSEERYVQQLRGDIIRTQLVNSLTAGAQVPRAMAEALYRHRQERRVAETLFFRDSDMPTPEDPGDEELRAYHRENPGPFTAPELRALTAVVLSADDLAEEIAVSDADIEEAYDIRRAEFTVEELREVRQIVLSDQETAEQAHQMLEQGRDFVDVATELTNQTADDLSLGAVTRDQMLPEMAEAAFALAPGTYTEPVQSPLGWHVMQVTGVEPGQVRTIDDVRDELRLDIARERAIDDLFELSNDLEDALGGGATLQEAAQQLDVPVLDIDSIDATGRNADGEAVAGIPPGSEFLDVAFDTEEGTESLLNEAGSDHYFVLRVDAVTPPALKPFDSVREDVLGAWQAAQRRQAAEERANRILDRLIGGANLADVAEETGQPLETTEPFRRNQGAGPPQELRDSMFVGDVGTITVARGNGGYYVARLTDIREASPSSDGSAVDSLVTEMSRGLQGDVTDQFTEALRSRYDVSINGDVLDQLF